MNVRVEAMSVADAGVAASTTRWGFAEVFIISQTALPALLFLPGLQGIRMPIRASAFLISVLAFVWWAVSSATHVPHSKAHSWVMAIVGLLAVMLFHPQTPDLQGGLAHLGVYVAVMAPLFWAPAFVRTPEQLARILWILLVCSGCNAIVGVLQVYDPARWLPAEFSTMLAGTDAMRIATFIGKNGQELIRPPGLFDTPGAVAGPAMAAALFGLVFATSAIAAWKRLLSLLFAGAGLAAIYLSQVRISLVIVVLMFILYTFTLAAQRRAARATQFGTLAAGIVIGSFVLAVALGGQTISDRVMTLLVGDPLKVYQSARGVQMSVTFQQLLFQAPFGSGLGRWGMPALYFTTFTPLIQPLWAEIQFTGWMIDGGVLMIALYCGAILVTQLSEWRVAMLGQHPRLATCGAVIFAVNMGTACLIFSFTPFVTQVGIQYWFLAGALHGVATAYGFEGA